MARIEYVDNLGTGWRVTWIDGRVDDKKVAAALARLHPEDRRPEVTVAEVAEVAVEARMSFHQRTALKRDRPSPHCDLFVLRPSRNAGITPVADYEGFDFLSEDAAEGVTYLVQIDKACPHRAECMSAAMEAVGLESAPLFAYRAFVQYRNWARGFAEELLVPYVAPCAVAQECMERRGFECCGQ